MARMIPAAERIQKARTLIQQARSLPVPDGQGRNDFSYIAGVKDLLRQARDLVKFIPMAPTTTAERRAEVEAIFEETRRAETEILRPG